MPVTKSAQKALKKSVSRRRKNIKYKEKIKGLRKEIKKLLVQKKTEEAKKILPLLYKALDKAAKENIIEKNTASRIKSRTSRSLKI